MKNPRHQAPPSNDGECVTPALARGRGYVAGRDLETGMRHRSISAADKATAADAAITLDAASVTDFATGHPGIDIEPMRERVEPSVQGSRCHHSHPAHHRISMMATQSPVDSATITGSANATGSRDSVTDASVCGSVRAVIRTSAFGPIN